jgi:hypothetical protein
MYTYTYNGKFRRMQMSVLILGGKVSLSILVYFLTRYCFIALQKRS